MQRLLGRQDPTVMERTATCKDSSWQKWSPQTRVGLHVVLPTCQLLWRPTAIAGPEEGATLSVDPSVQDWAVGTTPQFGPKSVQTNLGTDGGSWEEDKRWVNRQEEQMRWVFYLGQVSERDLLIQSAWEPLNRFSKSLLRPQTYESGTGD